MKAKEVLVMIHPASQERVNGIVRYAKEAGWHLLVQDRLGYRPLEWEGNGIIATVRHDAATHAALKNFQKRNIPIVDMTIDCPEIELPRVTSDHKAIGQLAAEHFHERHFKNIAWFSNKWGNVQRLRFEGLSERLGFRPVKWIGKDKLETARKPLAILSYDETDATILINRCRRLGISIPEEVALLSIGNDPIMCEMQSVTISSVDQNLETGGYEAAKMLDTLMNSNARSKSMQMVMIPPKGIVTRQSTDAVAISDPIVRKAVEYIREHIDSSFGVDQIADTVHVRRNHLDKLFAATLGHSVGEETRRQRLARVKMLLKRSDLSVAEIAKSTGYCTPSHLNNAFSHEFGITPAKWRKT